MEKDVTSDSVQMETCDKTETTNKHGREWCMLKFHLLVKLNRLVFELDKE